MKSSFFIVLGFLLSVCARGAELSADSSTPHHRGILSSLNLGIRYSSLLQQRGLIFYRDFQIDPVLGLFLFDDRLEYLGDSVGYRDFVLKDIVRIRTRMVSITDKPLFPAYDAVKFDGPSRSESYEWSNKIEIFLPGYNEAYQSELDFEYAVDLKAHHGQYAELLIKSKIAAFREPCGGVKLEPNLFGSIGWGDSRHNQYLYGPSGNESGFNNFSLGLWTVFPDEADRAFPIILLKYFKTLDQFQRAEYAAGRSEGWLFSVIATYGALE